MAKRSEKQHDLTAMVNAMNPSMMQDLTDSQYPRE